MSGPEQVLVVGAGPTGLTLALQAAANGAEVRIIERRPELFRPSRAMIVHIRTLEVLRLLGVVDRLLAHADIHPRMCVHTGAHQVMVQLADLDLPDTNYPHLTLVPQMKVEAVLAAALAASGIEVERGTELVDIDGATPPTVILRRERGIERATCRVVAGCDGADSTVRRLAGIGWHGGQYQQEIVLADLDLIGLDSSTAHVATGPHGLALLFPLGKSAQWRLLATRDSSRARDPGGDGRPVPERELAELISRARVPARIADIAWSTLIRPRHGIADAHRRGPVFLAGDAAHVHSPAGGQGMNTGIQDATNLGWKLAYSPHSSHPEELLDSYHRERHSIAQQVRLLTDIAFWAESGTGPLASLTRYAAVPLGVRLLPAVLGQRRLTAEVFRLLSQMHVSYRTSPISTRWHAGRGRFRAGDRLPDEPIITADGPGRLHALTARPGVAVLAAHDASPCTELSSAHVHIHRILSWPGSGAVAVRPDGYIGLSSAHMDVAGLKQWLTYLGAVGG